jgi:flagellar basal body rod protein FlgG
MMYVQPSANWNTGMDNSVRAMTADMRHIELISENVTGLGTPGYQAKRVVRRPFVEYLGAESVEHVVDTRLGRLRQTGRGEDFGLASEGYFQVFDAQSGMTRLTRDGRSQFDTEGYMRTATGEHFLNSQGSPIKLPNAPQDAGKQLKIEVDGSISYRNHETGELEAHGRLNVVTKAGNKPERVEVFQMHTEDGNVTLQEEFLEIIPPRRYFEANSQIFKIQSESLQRMLQELGRAT